MRMQCVAGLRAGRADLHELLRPAGGVRPAPVSYASYYAPSVAYAPAPVSYAAYYAPPAAYAPAPYVSYYAPAASPTRRTMRPAWLTLRCPIGLTTVYQA